MYKNIIIPVDLAHQEGLVKALTVGADLAKHYDAKITAVLLPAVPQHRSRTTRRNLSKS
jgi:universal stress protein F